MSCPTVKLVQASWCMHWRRYAEQGKRKGSAMLHRRLPWRRLTACARQRLRTRRRDWLSCRLTSSEPTTCCCSRFCVPHRPRMWHCVGAMDISTADPGCCPAERSADYGLALHGLSLTGFGCMMLTIHLLRGGCRQLQMWQHRTTHVGSRPAHHKQQVPGAHPFTAKQRLPGAVMT